MAKKLEKELKASPGSQAQGTQLQLRPEPPKADKTILSVAISRSPSRTACGALPGPPMFTIHWPARIASWGTTVAASRRCSKSAGPSERARADVMACWSRWATTASTRRSS